MYDLARSENVKEIICADARLAAFDRIKDFPGMAKVQPVVLDAADPDNLIQLFSRADAVVDLLPRQFTPQVCQAAIKTGVGVVNTNYAGAISDLAGQARRAGVAIMPECGLDPGRFTASGRRQYHQCPVTDGG